MRIVAVRMVTRDDEQEFVDALVEFVEQDPWTIATVIDDRRDPTSAEAAEFAYLEDDSTTNGYDRRWVEAINGVFADREVDVTVLDLTDAFWEAFIGPACDAIERGKTDVVLADRMED